MGWFVSLSKTDKLSKIAITSLLTLATAGLSSCGGSKPIRCYGVAKGKPHQALLMSAGECAKVANGKIKPATREDIANYKPFPYGTYIKCYGIVAAGKNDCGTKNTACAGTVSVAKRQDAWIAFPRELCNKVGGRVEEPKAKSQWNSPKGKQGASNSNQEII